ncbi:MAG: YbaK/EbsC family protein [Chloroflexi bacterium]|nr:YbaK/EbsC family protein [Chloroflexota bacterium]
MPFPYEAADELSPRAPGLAGDTAGRRRDAPAAEGAVHTAPLPAASGADGERPAGPGGGDADPIARARAVLTAAGFAERLIALPRSARTAELAAVALGVPQGAIVKSLLLLAAGEPLLVLVSGDRRADVAKVAALRGLPAQVVALAPVKIVEQLTGFPVGGVSPVTRTREGQALPTLMDQALFRFAEVWSAAGATRVVFGLPPADVAALAGAAIADVGGDP